jgi:CheY-like chemotaxis protein
MTRILIVDDEPEHARALSREFAQLRKDVTVLTSSSGKHATELLQQNGIDLVLTDLRMPDMDGVQLIAWIQGNRPDIAAFTMSAFAATDSQPRLDELGAIEHFPKPVDAQAVLRRFADTLHQTVRGHVQYISLASFLQVLEMERKTCTLTVTCGEKQGSLSVREGSLVGARTGALEGESAAIAIVAWPYPNIGIARKCDPLGGTFSSSLGFIVMEAMRVQDETMHQVVSSSDGSVWPAPHRTWRPSNRASDRPGILESTRARMGELGPPSGASALALVDTETGNVLCSSARDDCPVGELARSAAQLLQQESATLRLCSEAEGVEEVVLSMTTRCDVIRPLTEKKFALLIFAPEETNLVMARIELEYFIAAHGRS